jgi:hypothetical protein
LTRRRRRSGGTAITTLPFLSEQAKRNIITDLSGEKLCDELSRGTLLFQG